MDNNLPPTADQQLEQQAAWVVWTLLKKYLPHGLVVAGLGLVAEYNHQDSKTVVWSQAGQHFQDLVDTNNIWRSEIAELKAEVAELKQTKQTETK